MKKADRDLMNAIGEAAREPDWMDDEALERIASGEAGEDEIEKLRLASGGGPGFDEVIAALQPSGGALEDSLVSMIEALPLDRTTPVEAPRGGNAVFVAAAGARRRRWLRPALAMGVPAAAAAVALLILLPRGFAPDLPSYGMEFSGGERSMRSADEEAPSIPVLEASSGITIRLRPATKVEERVTVRGFLFDERGDSPMVIELPIRVSASGTVTIEGTAGDLFAGAVGKRRMAVVLFAEGVDLAPPRDLGHLGDLSEATGALLFVRDLELRP